MAAESPSKPRPVAVPFRYVKPAFDGPKKLIKIARTDHLIGIIQVLKKGGETNLHSHHHVDGFWMVISGSIRFYGDGGVSLGDFGPLQGIVVPRDAQYSFENVSGEDAELLQLEAFDRAIPDDATLIADKIDHEPPKAPMVGLSEL
jgi:mannose-6-phosphate isomerase-like protein (cupin superfamily)